MEFTTIADSTLEKVSRISSVDSIPFPANSAQFYASLPIPAQSRCIRLLDLDPLDDNCSSPNLIGHVRVVDLNDKPSFTALSYVWGCKTNPRHSIFCKSHDFDVKITEGCYEALWHIRKKFGAVTIWIDAICINQNDDEEKETQIAFMKDIYMSAKVVYVWLGRGNEKANEAIDFLHNVAAAHRQFHCSLLPTTPRMDDNRGRGWMRCTTWSDIKTRMWLLRLDSKVVHNISLDEILDRPWMRRAWTFQELIVASHPVFLCGDRTISWDSLLRAIFFRDSQRKRWFFRLLPWKIELPVSPEVLDGWRSIINLWLCLPRDHASSDRITIPETRRTANCALDYIRSREEKYGTWRSAVVMMGWISTFVPPLMLLGVSVLGAIVWVNSDHARDCDDFGELVSIIAYGNTTHSETDCGSRNLSGASLFIAIFVLALPLALVLYWLFITRLSFLLFGLPLSWPCSSAGDHKEALTSMIVALRQRSSTRGHDMAFSMLAVLQSLGAPTIQPDYNEEIHQTFRHFLEGLLTWNPSSVSMICHSRGAHAKGSSWVPNWAGPMVSPWLLETDTVGNTNGATRCCAEKPVVMLTGEGLSMAGADCGSILFRSHSISLGNEVDENFVAPLSQLVKELYGWWKCMQRHNTREYPYDHLYPSLFAALEGTSRVRRVNKSDGLYIPAELPYAFPYDYCSLKEHFEDFQNFFDIFRKQLRQRIPNRYATDIRAMQCDEGVESSTWSTIAAAIMAHEKAGRYAKRLAMALAQDQRCLFVLSNGYVGTGLEDLQPDDRIFLLEGVHVPMALRSVGEDKKYRVIGAVLVQGLMNWDDIRIDLNFIKTRLV